MATIRFTIHGTYALLQHNAMAMLAAGNGKATKAKGDIPTPEEEAEAGCYRSEDGALYHPCEAFRIAMINAGVNRKIGKLAATTTLQRTVHMLHERANLFHPETGEALTQYEIDQRSAVVQGNRILRCRPKIMPWATDVEFEYLEEEITPEPIVEMMERAGKIEGVGDYRPSAKAGPGRGGPFGRFAVVDWQIAE